MVIWWILAIMTSVGVWVVLRFAVGKRRLRSVLGTLEDSTELLGKLVIFVSAIVALTSIFAVVTRDLVQVLVAVLLWIALASIRLRFLGRNS